MWRARMPKFGHVCVRLSGRDKHGGRGPPAAPKAKNANCHWNFILRATALVTVNFTRIHTHRYSYIYTHTHGEVPLAQVGEAETAKHGVKNIPRYFPAADKLLSEPVTKRSVQWSKHPEPSSSPWTPFCGQSRKVPFWESAAEVSGARSFCGLLCWQGNNWLALHRRSEPGEEQPCDVTGPAAYSQLVRVLKRGDNNVLSLG